jgi:hypothetical protein
MDIGLEGTSMTSDEYRALICITTCERFPYLARHLTHFAAFCSEDHRFSLLVSLDGDERRYLAFCDQWGVPLIYSERREGVGLSKNRVLSRFPDFDYYFFVEDDVELVDGSVFPVHVEISRASGIHHFSLFERGGARRRIGESMVNGHRIVHSLYGGAPFNFFTGHGLKRVGGWHPEFAAYRRWGHTEHSHRFPRAELAPAPFNVLEDLATSLIWHSPPAVTRQTGVSLDDDQIARPEREIMRQGLDFLPVTTIAPFYFNEEDFRSVWRLGQQLASGERYPLIRGRERRRAHAGFHLWKGLTSVSLPVRWSHLVRSVLMWPTNPAVKRLIVP